jgi:glycosyltransferase involved in cell wall biosynthesis
MKITIVTTNGIAKPFYGWPERLQGRALVKKGHQVSAFTYLGKESWNNKPHEIIDGIKVQRVRRKDWLSWDLAKKFFQDGKPDVVHIHHISNQLAFEIILLCKARRIPVVMTPHGPFHDPYLVADRDRPFESGIKYHEIITIPSQMLKSLRQRFKPKRILKNYLTHSPLKLADKIIVLSQHEQEVLHRLGVPLYKIGQIPNALDPEWLDGVFPAPKPSGEFRVLYLGQLKYRKGFDLLAQAIPLVVAQIPNVRFVFAGHSPIHANELNKILDENKVRHLVELPGQVSEAEKAALFLGSDLYVLPTRYEGFGIPLIEAMSADCPVISTDIPVINEIIRHEHNGLLFEYNNSESLANTIIQALQDQALRRKLAIKAKAEIEKYYTANVIEQIEQVYRQLIEVKL